MNWIELDSNQALEQAISASKNYPVVILKHSTRCSISSVALNRLERAWNEDEVAPAKAYFLDLITHRDVSAQIAESFGIYHESPQILIIFKGECVYHNSHMAISYASIKGELDGLKSLAS